MKPICVLTLPIYDNFLAIPTKLVNSYELTNENWLEKTFYNPLTSRLVGVATDKFCLVSDNESEVLQNIFKIFKTYQKEIYLNNLAWHQRYIWLRSFKHNLQCEIPELLLNKGFGTWQLPLAKNDIQYLFNGNFTNFVSIENMHEFLFGKEYPLIRESDNFLAFCQFGKIQENLCQTYLKAKVKKFAEILNHILKSINYVSE